MALRRLSAKRPESERQGGVRPHFGGVERSELLRNIERANGGADNMSEEDQEILLEAYERFEYCSSWESVFRDQYVQDVKFANADPDNGWQWPDDLRRDRMIQRRPALTINKVQNHVKLVVNDGKQNKAAIEIKPAGKESSFQAAQGFEGLIRNIEYQSTATTIYDDCLESAVEGGIGYGRVLPIYPDPRSFDQELRIMPVQSHMNVFLDPDIKQKNGSDAKFGFIFEDVPARDYEREYDEKAPTASPPLAVGLGADWVRPEHVRIAEYYRIDCRKDELIYFRHGPKGDPQAETIFLRSEVPQGMRRAFRLSEQKAKKGMAGDDVEIITRPTEIKRLQWYKIGAHKILDRQEYPIQYIPIFRFVGRERVIENKLERKGLVRGLKDAQRMYNYNSSAEAEAAAVATKTNWLVALEAINGYNTMWDRANVDNKPYLPWRHKDRDGDPIPPPQRIDPARSAEAYLAGMEIASRELEMASGQGPAQFGKPQQEKTGRAINETRRQGEILTFDFIDNQSLAIQYVGMILLDWIPHVYKTRQVVQILDKDGTERSLTIDPQAQSPYQEMKDQDQVMAVLNPTMGRYKVQAQTGPAYATQRQEAWNAFVQIVTGAPELINEIGDLMFLSADFPMADKISERLRNKIKKMSPWLIDENASDPKTQMLEQQIQQAGQQIAELLQQLAEKDRKLRDQTADINIKTAKVSNEYRNTDINEYKAHTDRITAVSNAQLDFDREGGEAQWQHLVRQMIEDALSDRGDEDNRLRPPAMQPDRSGEGGQLPQQMTPGQQPGAEDFMEPRLADDGHHYVRHGGKHYRVAPEMLNGGGIGQ